MISLVAQSEQVRSAPMACSSATASAPQSMRMRASMRSTMRKASMRRPPRPEGHRCIVPLDPLLQAEPIPPFDAPGASEPMRGRLGIGVEEVVEPRSLVGEC